MNKLFLDTNVVIDFLCEREGFYLPATRLIAKGYQKKEELFCSSLTFATASYLMERTGIPNDVVFYKLSNFLKVCKPTTVDCNIIEEALTSSFIDFEDALQYYSARSCGANIIITRNKSDFMASELPVLTPNEYLDKKLAKNENDLS